MLVDAGLHNMMEMAQSLTDDQVQQLVESFEAKKKEMNPATAARERMEK